MRRLACGEFDAHDCANCALCTVISERLSEGTCPYDVCPYKGAWVRPIPKKEKEKKPEEKKQYITIPVKNKHDLALVVAMARQGMMATQIAKKLDMRPQIVAEIIRTGKGV